MNMKTSTLKEVEDAIKGKKVTSIETEKDLGAGITMTFEDGTVCSFLETSASGRHIYLGTEN